MIFRVARHTNRLKALKEFYTSILHLDLIGEFNDHDGYDGIFLGKSDLNWHLEFTSTNEEVEHKFDEDDALVLYPTCTKEYDKILNAISVEKIEILRAKNVYWRTNGTLIQDPDGFNIIISKQKVPN